MRWKLVAVCVLFLLNLASASAQPLVFKAKGRDIKMYDDSRALIIGMNRYKKWDPLPTVAQEAEVIRKALIAQNFPEANIQMENDLDDKSLPLKLRRFLMQPVGRDTRMLVFFAGHGWTDGEFTGYLVPVNSPGEDQPGFREGLVSMADITNWSLQSKAKHILFVFDSCFSGAVFLTRSNLRPSELFLNDADQPVRQFLTSGSATDSVPAKSEFARKFVEGLNGAADIYADGVITANELGYWLKAQITPLGAQTPQYGSSTLKAYRHGDTLFLKAGVQPEAQEIPLQRPASSGSTRSFNISTLGRPDSQSMNAFAGIDVVYYQKVGDSSRVAAALERAKIPFSKTRASRPQEETTNGIACSKDVPVKAIQDLAQTLIDGGVVLNAIFPFSPDTRKHSRLEVLTTAQKGGPGLRQWRAGGITREEVAALTKCPG